MADLTLDTRTVRDVAVLYPRGHVNAHTVKDFEGGLLELIGDGRVRIVVSGDGLKYISSAGLGALMGVIEEARSQDGDIRLSDLCESVYNVFDILGFTHLFKIFDTEEEALRSFSGAELNAD